MRSILEVRTADVVSDVLAAVRVRTTVYCRSEMRAPWGFGVDAHGNPSFHVVTRGSCWLEAEGDRRPRRLRKGDLVLLPQGPTHWVRDKPSSPVDWLENILAQVPIDSGNRLRFGGNGAATELICGAFVLEGTGVDPLLRSLPRIVCVNGVDGTPAPWVAATLELLSAVTSSDASGAEAVVARLAETMVMQALRSALADVAGHDPAQVEALRDPQIAAAIRLIHAEPGRPWTVERLASEVGYSRSAFASHFRRAVGESPFAYLTRARLTAAGTMLDRTTMPIAEVATRVGYANEASFGRAFRRMLGVSPGAYRHFTSRPADVF